LLWLQKKKTNWENHHKGEAKMKKSWKNFLTACLFSILALILAGCYSSGKNGTMEEKMDDSMSGSMEMIDKENKKDTMSGYPEMMDKEKMKGNMSDSMEMMEKEKMEKMKKDSMQETMN
jgi:hypothetical protein